MFFLLLVCFWSLFRTYYHLCFYCQSAFDLHLDRIITFCFYCQSAFYLVLERIISYVFIVSQLLIPLPSVVWYNFLLSVCFFSINKCYLFFLKSSVLSAVEEGTVSPTVVFFHLIINLTIFRSISMNYFFVLTAHRDRHFQLSCRRFSTERRWVPANFGDIPIVSLHSTHLIDFLRVIFIRMSQCRLLGQNFYFVVSSKLLEWAYSSKQWHRQDGFLLTPIRFPLS